jgi:hypothetical protein
MRSTLKFVVLWAVCTILQENTPAVSRSDATNQLKRAFNILIAESRDLKKTDPNKIEYKKPIDSGVTATWIDEELGQACSMSMDKINEHTTMVLFSHGSANDSEKFDRDFDATKKLAVIRISTNLNTLEELIRRKREDNNSLQLPSKP